MTEQVDSLLLIDGHALAFYSWHTSYPNAVGPIFIERLGSKIGESLTTGLVVAFDPPPPTFRHELYPPYKANRPEPPEVFLRECTMLEDLLIANDVAVCKVPGYEADDVLGTLSHEASANGIRSLVSTCDLDLLQLIDDNTTVEVFSQYWPTRLFDAESAMRRFGGISPAKLPDLKALMGDKSDNYPGVPGIGEKIATSILSEVNTLDDLYSDLDIVSTLTIRGKSRLIGLLTDYQEDAYVMKQLATICRDVPFKYELPTRPYLASDLKAILSDWHRWN